VYLEGLSKIILGEEISITMKVTYDSLTNEDSEAVLAEAKLIIIQNLPFSFSNFQLYRRYHDYNQ